MKVCGGVILGKIRNDGDVYTFFITCTYTSNVVVPKQTLC